MKESKRLKTMRQQTRQRLDEKGETGLHRHYSRQRYWVGDPADKENSN
jgi:hypothetical protein